MKFLVVLVIACAAAADDGSQPIRGLETLREIQKECQREFGLTGDQKPEFQNAKLESVYKLCPFYKLHNLWDDILKNMKNHPEAW